MQSREKSWGDSGSAVNSQQACILYKGIPQEVTDWILEYTLSKDTDLIAWAARNIDGISAHNFDLRNDYERERPAAEELLNEEREDLEAHG